MSIFTAKKEKEPTPNNPLAELNQTMADLQARRQESERLLKLATDELMPLLTTQRRVDQERPRLVAAKQSADFAAQEARASLARVIGRPEESTAIETLDSAEQALRAASDALATCDASFDRAAAHTRILALRETVQTQEAQARELGKAFERAREERKTTALVEMYRAYERVFHMFEYGGPALYELRNDDPQAYDQLFLDLRIDEWQISELLVQQFNFDTPDYRPELRMRQLAIRERLAQLGKK